MTQHSDVLSGWPDAEAGEEEDDLSVASDLSLPEQWRLACEAQQRLRQLGMPRVNVLFVGTDEVVWRVLATTLSLAAPVVSWRPGEPMVLPENASARTLIIREVGEMSGAEQVRLLQWLDGAVGRTQVICTSAMPLMPCLDAGRFIKALYYRLNTVCIDLRPGAEAIEAEATAEATEDE